MRRSAIVILAGMMAVCLGACAGGSATKGSTAGGDGAKNGAAQTSAAQTSAAQENAAEDSVASSYPDGDLRILVPVKTGGFLDVQVRTTAKYLAEELGVNVIVENVAGAGGQLGTTEYLKEKPNTSTILLTDAWLMTAAPLMNPVQYKVDDYIPIIDHNSVTFCMFANPSKSGIHNFEDLKEYGKENRVLFASGGPGTSLYIVQKSLMDALDIKSDTISQNSNSEGWGNLMAGTVDVAMISLKEAADYVASGDAVPIVWFGEGVYQDDGAYTEGVPSVVDKGLNLKYQGFYYYSIRKGTDPAIVAKLHDAFAAVYANEEFIAEREAIDFEPKGLGTEEIESYLAEFTDIVKNTFSLE